MKLVGYSTFDIHIRFVSPCISLYHIVSVCNTLYQSVSPCISLYHLVSVCITLYHSALSVNSSKNSENSTDVKIKIPIEYYSANNRTNLNYESDSAYEYHDLEDYSCNLHSPVTSLGSHSEIVGHKPKEIDHPDVPSHKMWLKSLGLTVHNH